MAERFYCTSCRREWVHSIIAANPLMAGAYRGAPLRSEEVQHRVAQLFDGTNACPACGGEAVRVTYRPGGLVGDLPRTPDGDLDWSALDSPTPQQPEAATHELARRAPPAVLEAARESESVERAASSRTQPSAIPEFD